MDKRTYRMIDKVEASGWKNLDTDKVERYLKCLYTVEKMSNFLKSSLDCKNLIYRMEKELRIRRRPMSVIELKEAA